MTPPSNAGGEGREVLKACPFCGGNNIAYVLGDGCEYTTCDDCLANGPVAATEAEAQAAWNTRPARENAADRAADLVEAAVAEADELLDMLRDECWDLRCFDIQTGGGDADVGWTVIGHWQAEPREREIAQGWSDDPRVALREARKTLRPTPSQEASNVG